MTRTVRCLVLVALLLAAMPGAAGAAQTSDVLPLDVAAADLRDHPQIRTVLTAPTQLTGRALSAADVTVLEDGEPKDVELQKLPADELEVVLLVDTSGSMRGSMEAAKTAAAGFVEQLPADVRVAVLGFGTQVSVISAFESERSETSAAIASLQPSGETALYDAVDGALDQFDLTTSTRRAVVLLSDGGDTASTRDLEVVRDRLSGTDVALHGVELVTPESDRAALEELTSAADGRLVSADDPTELAEVYQQLSEALVNQYALTFTADGNGRTTFSFTIETGDVRARAEQVVTLPAAPEPTDPPRLQIVEVDASAHPNMELRVVAPRQLSERELQATSFTVIENGREQPVSAAKVQALDLEVMLVIDTSGSMQGRALEAAKDAAVAFLGRLPQDARVAVHAFGDQPRVLVDFTDDLDEAAAAIEALEATGETALYDAAITAVDAFAERDASARSVVLLSDGGDTVSEASRESAVRRLGASGVALHAIELQTPESDRTALDALVAAADGSVTSAEDPEGLAKAYDAAAGDIANQYLLRYTSTAAGSAAISVEVDAEGITAGSSRALDLPAASGLTGFLGSRSALITGASLWYLSLALIILALLAPRQRRGQLRGVASRVATGKSGLSGLASQATHLAQQTLQRGGKERGLNAALERAGIDLRPGEYVVLVACGAVAALVLGALVGGPLLASAMPFFVLAAGRFILSVKGDRRQAAFADQLGETLQLLASSLRAGYSLMQAIDSVAREAEAPSSDEFHRLVVETRLGRDLGDAMRAMEARLDCDDFTWVLQAIEINREVGGDLAEVLDTVAGTIRDRGQIRRQVQTLSAEGRMSAYVLMALPFGVGLFMAAINPDYMREFVTNGVAGYAMLGASGLMLAIGGIWLQKLIKIEF